MFRQHAFRILFSEEIRKEMSSFMFKDSSVTNPRFKKRGWLEITAEILAFCVKGKAKNHILLYCNINSTQIRRYIDSLLQAKLLQVFKNGKTSEILVTTEKGKNFLCIYSRMKAIPC